MPAATENYVYVDQYGDPVYRVVRTGHGDDKGFKLQSPIGNSWIDGLNGASAVPYHLPEVQIAVNTGRPVWILEGEKDVETAIELGLCATCNHGGAGKWREDHAKWLRGAERIDICYDRDAAGRSHAHVVADSLRAVGISNIHFWRARHGNDLTEHIGEGFGLEQLVEKRPVRAKPKIVAKTERVNPDAELPVAFRLVLALSKGLKAESGKDYQFNALCPAHDDRSPSLSIKLDPSGRTLLKCQAGCTFDEVAAAYGIEVQNLNQTFEGAPPSLFEKRVEWRRADEQAKQFLASEDGNVADLELRSEYLQDKLEREVEPARYLVDGLLVEHGKALLVSDPKAGKTRFVISLMKAIADREPFLNRSVTVPEGGKVLYINYDMPEALLLDWMREAEIKHPENIIVTEAEGFVLPFWEPDYRDEMAQMVRDNNVCLIIFDLIGGSANAIVQDENDNSAWGRYYGFLKSLRARCNNPAVVGLHHSSKADKAHARGASAIEGFQEATWFLQIQGDSEAAFSQHAPRLFKARGRGVLVPPIELVYNDVTGLYSYDAGAPVIVARADRFSEFVSRVVEWHSEHKVWPNIEAAKPLTGVGGARRRAFIDDARAGGYVRLVDFRPRSGGPVTTRVVPSNE